MHAKVIIRINLDDLSKGLAWCPAYKKCLLNGEREQGENMIDTDSEVHSACDFFNPYFYH